MTAPPARARFTLGIRAWVLIASLLAVLPLLGFSSWIVFTLERDRHAEDAQGLLRRTQSLALTVKRRFDHAALSLSALAVSQAARQEDFASLYEQAAQVMHDHPDAVAISLARPDGTSIFSTAAPYGTVLARSHAATFDEPVFARGATVDSPLFAGALTGRQVMAVSVPVRVRGAVGYALRMTLPTESLSAVLGDQVLPPEWTAAVLDPRLIIAGRTGDARLVGQHVSPTLGAAIEGRAACPFETHTLAGLALTSCFAPLPGSDWRVAVGVPSGAYARSLRTSLLQLLAAGLASVVLGTIGALLIANLIRAQVKLLAAAADSADAARMREARTSPIREIAKAGEGLRHARRREDALALQLSDAQRDSLTGLAGRRLFQELVARDLAKAEPARERIALLFIDLDGFKPINDRLGHDAGDELLRGVAGAIRGVIRATDIASRPGGDEFVVYLRGKAGELPAVCAEVAQRLIDRVAALVDGLGCSIGVAIGRADADGVPMLLAAADRLMLQAKAEGKGRFRVAADAEDAATD